MKSRIPEYAGPLSVAVGKCCFALTSDGGELPLQVTVVSDNGSVVFGGYGEVWDSNRDGIKLLYIPTFGHAVDDAPVDAAHILVTSYNGKHRCERYNGPELSLPEFIGNHRDKSMLPPGIEARAIPRER